MKLPKQDLDQLYATDHHREWTLCFGCKLTYPYRFTECPRCGSGMQGPKLTLPYPGTDVYGKTWPDKPDA